jgi:hypothetical protein
MLQLVVKVRGR